MSSPEYCQCGYIDQLVTLPLQKLFKYYQRHWWVWPEQLHQIKNNRTKNSWRPSTQLKSEISISGVPISREEVIESAIPYEEVSRDPELNWKKNESCLR